MLISDDEMREEMSTGCDCSQQASRSIDVLVAEQMPVLGYHQFLLDHLLISSSVIKSQTHLVQRQEIMESASAVG